MGLNMASHGSETHELKEAHYLPLCAHITILEDKGKGNSGRHTEVTGP